SNLISSRSLQSAFAPACDPLTPPTTAPPAAHQTFLDCKRKIHHAITLLKSSLEPETAAKTWEVLPVDFHTDPYWLLLRIHKCAVDNAIEDKRMQALRVRKEEWRRMAGTSADEEMEEYETTMWEIVTAELNLWKMQTRYFMRRIYGEDVEEW